MAPTTFMSADAVVAVSLPLRAARTRSRHGANVWESAGPQLGRWRADQGATAPVTADQPTTGDGSPPADAATETITSDDDPYAQLPADLRALDVMSLSIEAVRDLLIRYRLAGYPPDLLIQVPTHAVRMHDFHRATEMIEVGRRAALDALASSPFA